LGSFSKKIAHIPLDFVPEGSVHAVDLKRITQWRTKHQSMR
jgi:hypothetical protein